MGLFSKKSSTSPTRGGDLSRLINEAKWKAATKLLTKEIEVQARQQHAAVGKGEEALKCSSSSSSLSSALLDNISLSRALRIACRHRPPLETVKSILDLYPGAASEVDTMTGRYPLHVAVDFCASVEVIEFLAGRCPAGGRDGSGRTALHLTCDTYVAARRDTARCCGSGAKNGNKKSSSPNKKKQAALAADQDSTVINDDVLRIVKFLRCVAPYCVNLEDESGRTALECAIERQVGEGIVGVLHIWSQRDWKNRKRDGYGEEGGQEGLWNFKDGDEKEGGSLWGKTLRSPKNGADAANTAMKHASTCVTEASEP